MKHLQSLQKLLRNNKGETLVEVLASIVVGTLSVTLLFGCIMTATQLDQKAKTVDRQHYVDLAAADAQAAAPASPLAPAPKTGTVTITTDGATPVTLNIMIYGGEGMKSYSYGGNGS